MLGVRRDNREWMAHGENSIGRARGSKFTGLWRDSTQLHGYTTRRAPSTYFHPLSIFSSDIDLYETQFARFLYQYSLSRDSTSHPCDLHRRACHDEQCSCQSAMLFYAIILNNDRSLCSLHNACYSSSVSISLTS